MSGAPITKVREHCSRLGYKFFEENGKKITLIKFGSTAEKQTFTNNQSFQTSLKTLQGKSGQTAFSKPLFLLTETIKYESIKELLVVFLTDGVNDS